MRAVLYILGFMAVIALGFWAYRENYATQAVLREVRTLQGEIADLREALAVQKAEWAYLNRPDRLRELVGLNFDSLLLLPMEPQQFASPDQVARPAPDAASDAAETGTGDGTGDGAGGGRLDGIEAVAAGAGEGL